jgi:hypothetical protein
LVNEKYVKNKSKGSAPTTNHKIPPTVSNSKSNVKKSKDQPIKTEHINIESKNQKTGLFHKKHKSNDPLHYYNNNHPLHPLPHKSSNNKTDSKKSHSEHRHHSRSKSSPDEQKHRSHNHRMEQFKRGDETKLVDKKKTKIFSKSPQPPAQPPPPKPIKSNDFTHKKFSNGHVTKRTTSSSPSSKNPNKNKYKKRSSTESSSIDA